MDQQHDQQQRHFPVISDPISVKYEPLDNSKNSNNEIQHAANTINNGGTPAAPKPDEVPMEPNEMMIAFSEKSIRRAFARKVFAILGLLLLKTTAYIALCVYVPVIKQFWTENFIYLIIGIPIYLITYLLILFVRPIRYTYPLNYIMLLLFSTSLTYVLGGVCSIYEKDTIMIAFGLTTVLCVSLIIFACQTKWDLTGCGMFIFSLAVIFLMTCIISLAWMSRAGQIWLACLGIVVFSIFLIYDVQLIISGTHSRKISPEEHIFAVTILYLDIINIFLEILRATR